MLHVRQPALVGSCCKETNNTKGAASTTRRLAILDLILPSYYDVIRDL